MPAERIPPIVLAPSTPPQDASKSAAFIFVHGLGDDAEGVGCRSKQRESYLTCPGSFPTPSRPELEDEEDEQGITSSMQYLVSLIDDLVSQGVPEKRIVLGGFSQGHAMALFTGLTSGKYSGRLGGLVGLSGYLPLIERIPKLREAAGLPEKIHDDVQVFIARGTRDMLVPKRYLTLCANTLLGCGVEQEHLTVKEYEGMGHLMSGAELRDLCLWLEGVVPPLQ